VLFTPFSATPQAPAQCCGLVLGSKMRDGGCRPVLLFLTARGGSPPRGAHIGLLVLGFILLITGPPPASQGDSVLEGPGRCWGPVRNTALPLGVCRHSGCPQRGKFSGWRPRLPARPPEGRLILQEFPLEVLWRLSWPPAEDREAWNEKMVGGG
jgi:hypothetical protein